MTPKNPEAAIAFDEKFVRELCKKAGLTIAEIEYGTWARPGSPYQLQDMVVGVEM